MYAAELFKLSLFLRVGKKTSSIHRSALSLDFPAWTGNDSTIRVSQFKVNLTKTVNLMIPADL